MIIEFHIPGEPKPHPRPRAFVRSGHASIYTPKSAQDRKYNIQQFALDAMKAAGHEMPMDGLVSLEIEFVFPRPKNKIWKTKLMPRERLAQGPDLDNLSKSVMDAMNQIVYMDDRQVAVLIVSKWMAAGDESAGIRIRVEVDGCPE